MQGKLPGLSNTKRNPRRFRVPSQPQDEVHETETNIRRVRVDQELNVKASLFFLESRCVAHGLPLLCHVGGESIV